MAATLFPSPPLHRGNKRFPCEEGAKEAKEVEKQRSGRWEEEEKERKLEACAVAFYPVERRLLEDNIDAFRARSTCPLRVFLLAPVPSVV